MFADLFEQSWAAMQAVGTRPADVPSFYKSQKHSGITLQTHFGVIPGTGDYRSVHILGPRLEIINVFFYPDPHRALPVFAMEYVLLGKKPVIAVLDLVDLAHLPSTQNRAAPILDEPRKRHGISGNHGDMPGWYEDCRSGHDIFVRPAKADEFLPLVAVCEDVLASLLTWVAKPQAAPPEKIPAHSAALYRYKNHHREHSPGLTFLNRTFGEAWTREFLARWHFGPPLREARAK